MAALKQIIAFFTVFCLVFQIGSPARALTIKEEKALSKEFLKAVRANYTLVDHPMIHGYINELGRSIVSGLPAQPFEYHFHVIRQDTINAFAGPGGHIFVFSGLFAAMETESELAGILAHEIAHVSARHIADLIEKSKKSQMVSVAGLIAGILVGLGGASAVGSALSIGSIAAGQSMILAYSRENEMEADYLGRQYLRAAGYSLYGLRRALQKIRAREWYGEKQVPTYLKTHPATRERLAELDNMLSGRPEGKPENSFAFQRARAALMALYGDPAESARRFRQRLEKDPNDAAALYGLALALAQGGRPGAALEKMESAAALRPEDPYMTVDLGRIRFLAGRYEEAVSTLSAMDDITRYGPQALLYLGRSRLALGDYAGAAADFEKLHEAFPENEEALLFLGRAKGEQGRLGEAHYYLGMYYRKKGDVENARFHLGRALEKNGDPVLEEKIRGEIKNLESSGSRKHPEPPHGQDWSGIGPLRLISGQSGKTSW